MKENKYNDPRFFEKYSRTDRRSAEAYRHGRGGGTPPSESVSRGCRTPVRSGCGLVRQGGTVRPLPGYEKSAMIPSRSFLTPVCSMARHPAAARFSAGLNMPSLRPCACPAAGYPPRGTWGMGEVIPGPRVAPGQGTKHRFMSTSEPMPATLPLEEYCHIWKW